MFIEMVFCIHENVGVKYDHLGSHVALIVPFDSQTYFSRGLFMMFRFFFSDFEAFNVGEQKRNEDRTFCYFLLCLCFFAIT